MKRLIEAIETATAAEWERAHAACSGLFEMIRLRHAAEIELLENGAGLAGLDDFTARFGVSPMALTPVFLVLATPEWVTALEDQLKAFGAMATVLAELLPDLRCHLVPAAEKGIPAEVESRMVSWLRDRPDVIAGLGPYLNTS